MDQRLVVESPQIREAVDLIVTRARPKRARVRCKKRESKQTLQGFVQAPGAFIAQRACRTGKKKVKEQREDPIHSKSQWFLFFFLFISNFPVFLRNIGSFLGFLLLNSTLLVSFLEPGKEGTTLSPPALTANRILCMPQYCRPISHYIPTRLITLEFRLIQPHSQ